MNLLIDGSSLLWRTHYANKAQRKDSVNNNIQSFLVTLKSYAKMYNCRNIYIAWDKKMGGGESFRKTDTSGEYKGQRDKSESVVVYEAQPEIAKMTELLGCKNLYPWLLEADDIIAWLSHTLEDNCVIITTDQDMLQLITNKTSVFSPKKKITIDKSNFQDIVGMPIEHFLPYKAILGDVSDNIRGVYGYGPVNAKKLAKLWCEDVHSVDEEKLQIIEKNLSLMDLSCAYNKDIIEVNFYEWQLQELDNIKPELEIFKGLCETYNFQKILTKFHEWETCFDIPYLYSILGKFGR